MLAHSLSFHYMSTSAGSDGTNLFKQFDGKAGDKMIWEKMP